MSVKELLSIEENEKALLWDIFHYEKMLDDNEEVLVKDLKYYEERIRTLGNPNSPLEIGLLTIYMKHIKNIRELLLNLQDNRNEKLKKQLDGVTISPTNND